MTFSSLLFLFGFFPIFLTSYFITPARFRNYTALLASLLFYAWDAPRFIFVLLGTCLVDYLISREMHKAESSPGKRKALLITSITMALSILFYFKYSNFFVEQLSAILSSAGLGPVPWVTVALPIGISFFTFHKMSYVIDVYQRTVKPAQDLPTFFLYITLFPQLVAGPIIRYHDICDQLVERRHSLEQVFEGLFRFVIGLAKKILIADPLAAIADKLFLVDLNSVPTSFVWLGIISYAYQIYFDFSGYSDMAIGLGRVMGFRFPENFNQPYTAQTMTEFWRRWHMTLSSWMREYLYIPLGGNRVGKIRRYVNLWSVFLLSGLWHGASWNFVIWGAFHGLFLVVDKLGWTSISERLPRLINTLITFVLVLIGWVFFRAETLPKALEYLQRMLTGPTGNEPLRYLETLATNRSLFTFCLATIICFLPILIDQNNLREMLKLRLSARALLLLKSSFAGVCFFLCVVSIANANFIPFIYFRF